MEEVQNNPINLVANQSIEWFTLLVPNAWIQGFIIILIAILFAWLIERIINVIAKPLFKRQFNDGSIKLVETFKRPIFLTLILIISSIMLPTTTLPINATGLYFSVLGTLTTIFWFIFTVNLTRSFLIIAGETRGKYDFIQPHTVPLFDNSAKIILFLASVYFVFLSWGINVSALLASAGIVGLALSLGAQSTLANIFGGMSILADTPYKVGDYINLDTGERGEVTNIGLRSTRILTRDDVEISVPNNVMSNAKIINESGGPYTKFRIRIAVGVAYGSDIELVEKILVQCAKDHNEICISPEPRVRFRKFGPSSLDFELLAWCEQPALRGKNEHELNTMIYRAFNENEIKIPFPQQEIHLHHVKDNN